MPGAAAILSPDFGIEAGSFPPSRAFGFDVPSISAGLARVRRWQQLKHEDGRLAAASRLRSGGTSAALSTGCNVAKIAGERAAEFAEIRAIAAGDEDAFARLIGRETPKLLRFAQGVLGNAEEAEDVVQESLIKLWEVAAVWRPDARIGTWLHTVTYNQSVDRLRRRRAFVDESALDEIADPSPLAQGIMEQGELARLVRDIVDRLPHRQRSAVLLFHMQELPQSEAARVMGISESAFESLLARARRQMRDWLTAAGAENE